MNLCRGTCTFVSKVRVAEAKKNAAAVLILQSYEKRDQDVLMEIVVVMTESKYSELLHSTPCYFIVFRIWKL